MTFQVQVYPDPRPFAPYSIPGRGAGGRRLGRWRVHAGVGEGHLESADVHRLRIRQLRVIRLRIRRGILLSGWDALRKERSRRKIGITIDW